MPFVQVTVAEATSMVKEGGAGDLKSIEQSIDKDVKPQSAVLKDVTVRGKVVLKKNEKKVRNVVAMLPGKGDRADEYIVIGGHYDHLGQGRSGQPGPDVARNSSRGRR